MVRTILAASAACLALAGCNESQPPPTKSIKVTSPEQQRLHQLDAFNLAIGLKRAIYDAGYTCTRVTDAGFVGEYKNLDMWTAKCASRQGGDERDWAIFAGPDGSAQVRDCRDIPGTGLPDCAIKKRPEGNFNEAG